MQVVAKAIDGAVVISCTIVVRITLSVMIVLFITKAVRATVGTERTIKVGKTFSVERVFVTIPVRFAVRVSGAMPIIMTGSVWPRPRAPRTDFDDATLDRETRKGD